PTVVAGALIVAVAVVVGVLARPVWALVLLPFSIAFGSVANVELGPVQVGPMEGLLALFFGSWLARGVARRELHVGSLPLLLPFGLWLAAQALSLLAAASLLDSLAEMLKWSEMAALYMIAARELRRRDVVMVVAAFLAAGALSGVLGVVQAVLEIGPPGFRFTLAGREYMRAYGTFLQPNPYAGHLGVTLPLAYGLAFGIFESGLWRTTSEPSPERRTFLSWLASRGTLLAGVAVCAGLMGLGLFFSLSRGAWIGAGLAALAVSMTVSRRALTASVAGSVAAVLFLALGGAALVPPGLRQRATDFLPYIGVIDIRKVTLTPDNFALIERLAHWWAAFGMFGDSPWLGVGIGNYAKAYERYALPLWSEPLGHAHNFYLNVAAEAGVIGLVAYLLFFGAALAFIWHTLRRATGLPRAITVGCLGAFIHLAVHNFFDNLYVHGIYLQIALLLAIVAVLARTGAHEEPLRQA
ncbi:MAG TPA: O-antigen ligase family protein, partial [Ardenticatenaceae bacterium]|nr:O-antigen ligase family protein [Ardenticatenaceae bacterium]